MLGVHTLTDTMCPDAVDRDSMPHENTTMVTIKLPAVLSLPAKPACLVSV